MPAECCRITDDQFDSETAQADLEDYRAHGPARHTELILEAVRSLRFENASLLDVGGGVGALHHQLLADGFTRATHVDASSAYLAAAREESQRRGHEGRVEFIHADFTDVAETLPRADLVTLDRVVCCYPDFHSLLKAASAHSARALALSYPRQGAHIRLFVWFANLFERWGGREFRVFVHSAQEMNSLLENEGFERISLRRLFVWEVALYARKGS